MKEENKPKCLKCKDTGVIEYHEIDGMTIYRWQKPLKRPCDCKQPKPKSDIKGKV